MERPKDCVWVKSRNVDGCPAVGNAALTLRGGLRFPKLVLFSALIISTRYSKFVPSVILNRLAIARFKLSNPGAKMVLRPTVRAFGRPAPWIQCTVLGSIQVKVSPAPGGT